MSTRAAALVLICCSLAVPEILAAEFHVDGNQQTATDTNPGTRSLPWRSIQRAANREAMHAGDTVYVKAGTYEERVDIRNSGQPGKPITFKAAGAVTLRGFTITSNTSVRIIGFEIAHTSSNRFAGIELRAAHDTEILDNQIHHTSGLGIWLRATSPSSNVVIRGNTIAYTGCIPGSQTGEIAISMSGTRLLAEYNDVSHVADFFNVWGQYNIIRNNYLHDCEPTDYPDFRGPDGHHIDGFQYFSTSITLIRNLMENNYLLRNEVPHGHVIILRDTGNTGSSELIFRRNLAVRNGSYAAIIDYFANFRAYHNTFVDMLSQHAPKARNCIGFTHGAKGGKIINNIFYDSAREGGECYSADSSSQAGYFADHNLAYRSGNPSDPHGLNLNPQFVDLNNGDIHLQPTSSAIDSGGPLTITASSGSGTVVSVESAGYFTDGWGIAEGDDIVIGSNAPIRVLAIDDAKNRLTVNRSITWAAGEPVSLSYLGTAPDRGAFEFRTGGYRYGITLASPSSGSNVAGPVPITATVTNPQCVRYVIFHINGIPIAKVASSPYSYTWDPPGDGAYSLEARAYANFADTNLTRSAVVQVTSGTVPGGILRKGLR